MRNILKLSVIMLCSAVIGLGTADAQVSHRGAANTTVNGAKANTSKNQTAVNNSKSQANKAVTAQSKKNDNAATSNKNTVQPKSSTQVKSNSSAQVKRNGNTQTTKPTQSQVKKNGNNNAQQSKKNGITEPRNNSSSQVKNGNKGALAKPGPSVNYKKEIAEPTHKDSKGVVHKGITEPNYVKGKHITPPTRVSRPKTIKAPKAIVKPSNHVVSTGISYIKSVLGLAFYSTISNGLTYLYNNNYYIDGYDDNTVYLREVTELDLVWEDVVMNYSSGELTSVQFIYSTEYDDNSRYNVVYNQLCSLYGDPVVLSYNAYTPSGYAAWYGCEDLNYATVEYYSDYATDGSVRYYTVLSYCSSISE